MPRDQNALQNQRAMMGTHPKVVERRVQKVNGGLDLGTALLAMDMPKVRQNWLLKQPSS